MARKWGDLTGGSHPPVSRRPQVEGKAARFHCCPCRILGGDMIEVFAAIVLVQEPEWVMGLVRSAECGFVDPLQT